MSWRRTKSTTLGRRHHGMKIFGMRFDRDVLPMSDQLTGLEIAMKKQMKFIIYNEHRTFSFLDFMHFEVDGGEYTMTYGTFRNKISKLRKEGIVELAYNSGIAFYTLKGVKAGKPAATSMTPNHIGVLLQHVHRVPNIRKHPLYKLLKHHPFNQTTVHDVHLRFTVTGLWAILSRNNSNPDYSARSSESNSGNSSLCVLETDSYSKDIRLQKRAINDLDIQITVHHTDTVTVVVGCSNAPIAVDEYGIIRLSEALSTIEDELVRLIQQHAGGNDSNIEIPNHMSWIVTRWDFGVDSLVTYTGEKFFFSWQASYNVLIVLYTKKWGENDNRIRVERQEFPDKPLGKALRERMIRRWGS
jgi:hypothetical protein